VTIANANVLSIVRLSEKGQLTIPAEYRRKHDLERDSTLALIQLGDVLILAPIDEMLTEITERMEASMRRSGVTIDDLMEETLVARAEITHEEFGEGS
jgi:bifunctional DNA-binding transcriptional regulator/antitoxin component of YhaV-PrlF toxin-antitoxin module